jgi:hypothetical protein
LKLFRAAPQFVLYVVLAAGCVDTSAADKRAYLAPGTQRMAERLRKHIEDAGLKNPNADLQRAESARAQLLLTNSLARTFSLRLDLAVNLLNGGKSEAARKEFENVRQFLTANGKMSARNASELRTFIALASLRLGEQENCLSNHTTDSCLFPIRAGGVHKLERGSRGAIRELTAQLKDSPGDLTARWLLNIAYMTLGEYPDKVPTPWRIDPMRFESDHPLPRFRDVAGPAGVDVDDLAGGSITEDFDGDGLLDILCSAMNWSSQLRFFRNNGDGTFTERTTEAGLTGELGGLNIMQTDYNNDGSADVLVLRGGWQGVLGRQPLSLLKNNGDGTFADVTEEAGLLRFHPTQTAVWFDFNNDGWLDLFVGNESTDEEQSPCELFRNNGDGTFTECAARAGVAVVGFVKGVACGDFNNDGWSDLYLSRLGQPNLLLRNDGPKTAGDKKGDWKFTDVTATAKVAEPIQSFPTWFFDYDNDGWLDLFVSGYFLNDVGMVAADYLGLPHNGERARLYHNNRDGTFTDVTKETGLYKVLLAMGANFGDLDNDGFLDFYLGTGDPDFSTLIPNRMFRNAGGKFFQDVTTAGGFGHLQKGHGISFADLDNDGQQDIYEVMGGAYSGDNYRNVLYENPGNSNHWITLKLEGVQSNRAALGARIKVTVKAAGGEQVIRKTVCTGGSFGASPFRQEIGLGQARSIQTVEIYWPVTGKTQTLTGLALDQFYQVREGDTNAILWKLKTFKFPAGAGAHGHHHHE